MIPWFWVKGPCGTEWRVVRGDEHEFSGLDGAEGVTLPAQGLIVVHEKVPYDRARVVFVHELLHAVLSAPGEARIFAKMIGCKPDKAGDREEDLVTYLGPKLADTLLRNGLLAIPVFL